MKVYGWGRWEKSLVRPPELNEWRMATPKQHVTFNAITTETNSNFEWLLWSKVVWYFLNKLLRGVSRVAVAFEERFVTSGYLSLLSESRARPWNKMGLLQEHVFFSATINWSKLSLMSVLSNEYRSSRSVMSLLIGCTSQNWYGESVYGCPKLAPF